MNRMLTLILTKLLQLKFRRTLCYADIRPVVPGTAFPALKPHIFSLALLLGHKTSSRQALNLVKKHSLVSHL